MPFFIPQRLLDAQDATIAHEREEKAALRERVAELERQVDDLHRQGYAVSAPPPARDLPPPADLDYALVQVINGFSTPEERAGWEAHFRARLDEGWTTQSILEEAVKL